MTNLFKINKFYKHNDTYLVIHIIGCIPDMKSQIYENGKVFVSEDPMGNIKLCSSKEGDDIGWEECSKHIFTTRRVSGNIPNE